MSNRKLKRKIRRRSSARTEYQSLELRRVLATAVAFAGGVLNIDLGAANDVALVDVNASGNVTVNGSDQVNVGGSLTTVAASSVFNLGSLGTSDFGQRLTLVGSLPSLGDIQTNAVDLISFQGSYGVDNLDLLGVTAVVQGSASTLTVNSQTNIDAIGDVLLNSPTNDFGSTFTANGANIVVSDINTLSLGPIGALGTFQVDAGFIDSLFSSIDVDGDTVFNVVDGVSFLQTSIDTTNLTINSTGEFSEVTLDSIRAAGDVFVSAATIAATSAWLVGGDTTIESNAIRGFSHTDVVDLCAADILTANLTITASNGGVVVGNVTASGNTTIDSLRLHVEDCAGGGTGGLASSNAGVATFSVDGNTTFNTQGSIDALLSQLDSNNLTLSSVFNDVILGTATTVLGDLNLSSGNSVETGSVTVNGAAVVEAAQNILTSLDADGNAFLDAGNDIDLQGLASNAAILSAGGSVSNVVGAAIEIQNTLVIEANSASLGTQLNDLMTAARIQADVQDVLEIEQDSSVRLMDISASDLSVVSTGTITNRADATIDVPGDVELRGTNIVIGQTATDTFNAGRVNFDAFNIVRINENSDTELFGNNEARLLVFESDGDITDDPNSVVDIAFSTLFDANNVTVGDTATDTFNSRTLSFTSPGHVDVTQDSRIFLTNVNDADQLTLSSSVSILDSPTTQVDVAGEVTFESPYINVGDNGNDTFNAGSVAFGTSGTVNLTEDSDTVFSGSSNVRQAIVRSAGVLSNAANATVTAVSTSLITNDDITLGTQAGDHIDIDRIRFHSLADVTIEQDDSLFFFGNNTAQNLRLVADGAIGDSGTAAFSIADHTWLTGTSIWLGEQSTDTFNTGKLTFEATGNVNIGEDSAMLLSGVNSAFNLALTSAGVIADEAVAETIAQKSATFTANGVTIGETGTDCFDIVDGASNLFVNAPASNVVFGC